MRIKKPKLFILSGKFEVAIVIQADSKDEALAYSQDCFASHVVVDTTGSDGIAVIQNRPIKIRKPRRFNPDVQSKGD